jgi:hypothetical protein
MLYLNGNILLRHVSAVFIRTVFSSQEGTAEAEVAEARSIVRTLSGQREKERGAAECLMHHLGSQSFFSPRRIFTMCPLARPTPNASVLP